MEWFADISGPDHNDLDGLSKSQNGPLCFISKQGESYILKSACFSASDDYESVRCKAERLVRIVGGAAMLNHKILKPLEVNGITRIRDDGGRDTFISVPVAIGIVVRAYPPVVTTDGTVQDINESDPIEDWALISQNDDHVAKVLRLFAAGTNDWISLYRIYEVIEGDVGNMDNIEARGWVRKKELKLFKHTANSCHAIGDDARHGKENTEPPKNPMSLNQANSLIEMLAQCWLASKQNNNI